jgi:hypothetical protein
MPRRPDARLVGICGDHLAAILWPRAGVREVYCVGGTWEHYSEKHKGEFDIDLAEQLLPEVLSDPLMVCDGTRGELLFIGSYTEEHYLVVPVKVLIGELWLATMFIGNRKRMDRRYARRGAILYKKSG